MTSFHYSAQLLHTIAINFFILFLLIVAKGWPITRRDMPFKCAFAIFWLSCLTADLITSYWTTITIVAKGFSNNGPYNTTLLLNLSSSESSMEQTPLSLATPSPAQLSSPNPMTNLSTAIIGNITSDQEQFNSVPRKWSLLLRFVIMVYFLCELRKTMILEQEKKKLQFYLNFGALTMVWFVHTLIVYIISLRVDSTWQSKLISGFSSAANFLGFAVTTRLLWLKNSRSYLFRKQKHVVSHTHRDGCEIDNFSTINNDEDDEEDEVGIGGEIEEYDGLEMRDLRQNRNMTNDNTEGKP